MVAAQNFSSTLRHIECLDLKGREFEGMGLAWVEKQRGFACVGLPRAHGVSRQREIQMRLNLGAARVSSGNC